MNKEIKKALDDCTLAEGMLNSAHCVLLSARRNLRKAIAKHTGVDLFERSELERFAAYGDLKPPENLHRRGI